MRRPIRPQPSDQEAEELFGLEDGVPVGGKDEGNDDWCDAVDTVKHDGDDDKQDMCKLSADNDDELLPQPCTGAMEIADEGWEQIQLAQRPVPVAEVQVPSRAEVARHNLTHHPYRNWCIWCPVARMPHTPGRALPACSMAIALLVFDYCSLNHSSETDFITVLVARIYIFQGDLRCPV